MAIDNDAVSEQVATATEPAVDGDGFHLEITFGSARFVATGPGDLVLNAYSAFMDRLSAVPASPPPADEPVGEASSEVPVEEPSGAPTATKDAPPLPQFMRAHKTKNNQGRAVVMAVWAKRYRGMKQFTLDELLAHWRGSGQKLPARAARDIGLAVSEGWLERLPDNKFQVTSYGERVVDEEMMAEGK